MKRFVMLFALLALICASLISCASTQTGGDGTDGGEGTTSGDVKDEAKVADGMKMVEYSPTKEYESFDLGKESAVAKNVTVSLDIPTDRIAGDNIENTLSYFEKYGNGEYTKRYLSAETIK